MGRRFPILPCSRAPTFPCPLPLPQSRVPRVLRLRVTPALGDLPVLTRKSAKRAYPPVSTAKPVAKRLRDTPPPAQKSKKLRSTTASPKPSSCAYVKKRPAPRTAPQVPTCSKLLENRLDKLLLPPRFGPRFPGARPTGNHGHVTVNGRVVDIPATSRPGDLIWLRSQKPAPTRLKANWNSPVWPTFPPIWSSTRPSSPPKVNAPDSAGMGGPGNQRIAGGGVYSRKVYPRDLSTQLLCLLSHHPAFGGVFDERKGAAANRPRWADPPDMCQALFFYPRRDALAWLEQTLIRWSSRMAAFSHPIGSKR